MGTSCRAVAGTHNVEHKCSRSLEQTHSGGLMKRRGVSQQRLEARTQATREVGDEAEC